MGPTTSAGLREMPALVVCIPTGPNPEIWQNSVTRHPRSARCAVNATWQVACVT
jgi:hypothetical protein